MKASKFTEAQIAFVLKQAEGGVPLTLPLKCPRFELDSVAKRRR